MLSITKAFNTMRNLGLDRSCQKTLKDLAHAEESEVDVGALHGLKFVHLLILLVINLIEQLLPMVAEVKEEFIMVNHLSFAVKEHGSGLTKVLTSIEPLAHAVVMKAFASVLENIDTINNK